MAGRDRNRDEDEARRRFDAVWPGVNAARPESTVDGWRHYDEKPPQGADGDPDAAAGPGAAGPDGGFGFEAGAGSDGGLRSQSGRAVLGAFDPGRRGIRALIAVGVAAVLIAAYLAWRAQPRAEPVAPSPSAARVVSPGPSRSTSVIVVAVQGKVAHPGLVRLPAGSRVADAIAAAGGPLPGVDLSLVNLARKLTDGELVVVGLPQPPGGGAAAAAGTDPASGTKINLNTASLTDLETLPGIGPALGQHILDYRVQHGDFHSIEDLRHVTGIGDAKFAAVKDLVTV